MNNNTPGVTDYPESLVLPGVRLQEALKHGQGVQDAFDTYCRRAFRKPETAVQGAKFLAKVFAERGDLLLGLVDVQHLRAELAAGSNVLCSFAAEQWDRNGNSDRLAALAAAVGDEWMDGYREPVALEFILALAAAVAIMHPEKTRILLDRCEAECAAKPAFKEALNEAREWQEAGELIAHASPDQKLFWHRQLASRVGDWVWDTAEAKEALTQLQRSMPEQGTTSRLLRDRVPGWAWNQRLERVQGAPVGKAEAVPAHRLPLMFGALKWAAALVFGVVMGHLVNTDKVKETLASWNEKSAGVEEGLGLASSEATESSVPTSEVTTEPSPEARSVDEPTTKADVAKVESPVASVEPNADALLSDPAQAETPMKGASEEPDVVASTESNVVSALPIAVLKAERTGWVRTPLGEELELAKATTGDGLVTDSAGRVWSVPTELSSSDTKEAAEIEPSDAVAAIMPSAADTTVVSASADAPVAKPAATAPTEVVDAEAKTSAEAAPASDEVVIRKPIVADATPFNLHPDYFTAESKRPSEPLPIAKTKTQSISRKSSSGSGPRPVVRSSASTSKVVSSRDDSKSFVTRANNIRMHYRNGVWESSPGAYLVGASSSPQEWARDMTLRERSSGTIPSNYMFQVLTNGAVQAVPDPRRRN